MIAKRHLLQGVLFFCCLSGAAASEGKSWTRYDEW